MQEVIEVLANRVLSQSVALERLTGVLERYTEAIDRSRRELAEYSAGFDDFRREMRQSLGQINERLGIISKDVDDSTKFQLQAVLTPKPEEKEHAAVAVVNALGKLPPSTLIMLLIAFILAAASGWLRSLL